MILTSSNERVVVVDACILAPMPLADTFLRLAEEPALYRIIWTEEILQEINTTLSKLGRTEAQIGRRLKFMREYFPEAMLKLPPEMIENVPHLPDADDKHVVAAAILGHADTIVTLNIRDFQMDAWPAMAWHVTLPMNF